MPSKQNQVVTLYARVSSEDQASDDHFSIEAQLNEMKEYAQARGWEIQQQLVDGGITGTHMDRPNLAALLETVKAGECDIVLVHELSRLSRSIYHTFDILEVLGEHNVGFASVKEPDFDFADPSSRLFLTILAAMNQYYIDQLRMHTSKAKRERARQGLYNASIAPYGYKHTGGPKDPPIIHEKEAEAVRRIFELYATGLHTYQEVADTISDEGYHPRRRKVFPKDTIAQIIRNRFYMGKVEYQTHPRDDVEIFEGQHEAIVSEGLWERCKRVRSQRSVSTRAVQKPYRTYLLSLLARCDVCHRSLRSQGAEAGNYYRETSYQRGYRDCPHQRQGTRTEPVDAYIDVLISKLKLPEDWLGDIRAQLDEDEEVESLRRKRTRLEQERRRIKRLYIKGEFEDEDLDLYQQEIARIRRELDCIPTYDQLESLKSTILAVQNLYETWDGAEPNDRRDLLRLMLRKVWVDVPSSRVVGLQPKAFLYPILRSVEMLEERELGFFVPRWSPKQAEGLINFTQLDPIVAAPEQGVALPYINICPLDPNPRRRMDPGISKGLKMVRETGRDPEDVYQIVHAHREPLPMGLRRWTQADGELIEPGQLDELNDGSLDLLATQFMLWDRLLSEGLAEELLAQVYQKLRPGGVWYLIDTLPEDMPAHWLYRYFPPAWEWVKNHTWNTYKLYNQLSNLGFSLEFDRQTFYQPIQLKAAEAIAKDRPGLLAHLPDQTFQSGMEKLRAEIETRGSDHLLGSEFNVIEVWAQKAAEEGA